MILIVIILVVAIVMIGAIISFHKFVDATNEKANAMSEEEKLSYSPFAEENDVNTSID